MKIPVIGTAIVNGVHWLQRLLDSVDYPVENFVIFNNNGKGEITEELDKIVQFLTDNPQMNLELGAHTDAMASTAYNLKLSQRRAESAVNYIIRRGITKDRIKPKGYGESQLINECSDGVECPEEMHQQNRRTEFKIIKISTE